MFGSLSSIGGAVAAPEQIQLLADLVQLLANPTAAATRIGEYRAAAAELRAAHEQLEVTQASFAPAEAAHQQKLATERAEHEAAIRDAQQRLDQDRLQQENGLAAARGRLAELEAKASAAVQANETLRADLERRLALLRSAAA
jgi:flagellar motility protein MotE (MotC chaperone)